MNLNVKILREGVKLPKYETEDASGFDLAAAVRTELAPGEVKVIPTGLTVELWRTGSVLYELQVRPRSGTSLKTPLRIANSPGTVDADYRGEIGIIAHNTGTATFVAEAGDRIAQGVVCPVVQCKLVEVSDLNKTMRGDGAYGHTGRKV